MWVNFCQGWKWTTYVYLAHEIPAINSEFWNYSFLNEISISSWNWLLGSRNQDTYCFVYFFFDFLGFLLELKKIQHLLWLVPQVGEGITLVCWEIALMKWNVGVCKTAKDPNPRSNKQTNSWNGDRAHEMKHGVCNTAKEPIP